MADENWQKVREIFDLALEKEPQERQSYLLKACGEDKILLAEVESLFSSFDKLDSFLEKPAVEEIAEVIETETKKVEKGKCFGHYEIIEQIGAGGMGEVFLARDNKLDRNIAIKVLMKVQPTQIESSTICSETKAASALNHPNILVIHEIGESVKANYIVSEFIKGKTLRETLKQAPLKLSEILDIAIQIASALSAAHQAGELIAEMLEKNPTDEGGQFASFKALLSALAGDANQAEREIRDALEKGKGFGHFHHTAYIIACAYAVLNKPEEGRAFFADGSRNRLSVLSAI